MCEVGRRLLAKRTIIVFTAISLLGITTSEPAAAGVSGENGKIAFVTDRDGNYEIYTMGPDGSSQVNLTNNPADDSDPDWSPDGRQIAFVSNRGGPEEVYIMKADGGGSRLLTQGRAPDWSSDGTKLALARDDGIYLIDEDGSNLRRITDSSGFTDSAPAWSPDGSSIAFIRRSEGRSPYITTAHLMMIRPGAANPSTVLVDEVWTAADPDWSPDGGSIAVEVAGQFGDARLLLVGLDDSTRTIVPTPAGHVHVVRPAWSPDGVEMAINMLPAGGSPQVFSIRPDGSNPVNITNHASFNTDPSWQPLNPYPAGLVDVATGLWYLRDEAGAVSSFYYGNPGDYPMVGDWNCDGIDTPGLYRQSDGFVYLRNSNTQGIANIRFFFGNPGDIPLAGDFDGDGCDTVSIYRPSEARIYVINELGANDGGLGAADFDYIFGNPGDKPFVGDFDGDGVDTLGLHRESTGFVYFRNSHTQGVANAEFFFGDPGDRLVAGDWGIIDGIDTPGIYRPSNTTFYFRFTNTTGIADAQYIWGETDWLPVAGDFE